MMIINASEDLKVSTKLLNARFRNDGRPHIRLEPIEEKALFSFVTTSVQTESMFTSLNACPFCTESSAAVISEKDRLGIFCRVSVCRACGLVFNSSPMTPDSNAEFYQTYWRDIQWGGDPEKNFRTRIKVDSYAWKRYAFVALHLKDDFKHLHRVAEAGCGDGCNLLPYYLSGKEVIGCDFDEESLAPGRREGMRLLKGDAKSLANTGEKADLVLLSHVVEHFNDIDMELQQIRALVKKGGYVYVEVPGIRNMNRKRSEQKTEDGYRSTNDILGYLQFLHNYHFELKTLVPFFQRNGFQLIYGDEWVRAIFKNTASADSGITSWVSHQTPIIEHLMDVERDYQSLYNQILIFGKKMLTRIRPTAIHTS